MQEGRPPWTRWVAKLAVATVLALVLSVMVVLLLRSPSNDRAWAPDHARLAAIDIAGDAVTIDDLRDFRHGPEGTFEEGYRSETYDLNRIRGVWFALAPFAERYRGLAHSFVTFEFEDDRFVAVSIEARRETDEPYSLLGGLMQEFEVVYVIGTEEDLLGQRAMRGDTLFLYPSIATTEQSRALFVDMLQRASQTQRTPEFYHTITNNCNTNLRDHVNGATEAELPWGWGILLPGFSDGLALDEGLLDTALDIEAARRRYRIDEVARRSLEAGDEGFSLRIRADR